MSTKQEICRKYPRIIKWSEADHLWIGSAPPLVRQCCHGDTVSEVATQLEVIVSDLAEDVQDGKMPTPEEIYAGDPGLLTQLKKIQEESLKCTLHHLSEICNELDRRIGGEGKLTPDLAEVIRNEIRRTSENIDAQLDWPFAILANYRDHDKPNETTEEVPHGK